MYSLRQGVISTMMPMVEMKCESPQLRPQSTAESLALDKK